MTEYRIVATLDEYHVRNGETYHYDTATLCYNGRPQWKVMRSRGEAEAELEKAKIRCAEFDRETWQKTGYSAIHYHQSNLRIQSREVTEWSDEP